MAVLQTVDYAETLDRIERDLGLSASELAGALGLSDHALDLWKSSGASPNAETIARLRSLGSLRDHLYETLAADAVSGWLRWTPHFLGGATPASAIEKGHIDRVETLLSMIDYGIFT